MAYKPPVHDFELQHTLESDYPPPLPWEEHYWSIAEHKIGWDLPLPAMYQNDPYWRGAWREVNFDPDLITLTDMQLRQLTVPVSQVRAPTMEEYDRLFRDHVERMSYQVIDHVRSGKVTRARVKPRTR